MLTELHRAAARHALIPLQNDHEFFHKADVLKRTFPQSVLDAIRAEKKMADQYNKDADEAGGAILTPEAGAYWEDVQLLIKRGKAAQARGDKKAEKEISLASERLLETFDERVTDHDKPKFVQLDAQRHDETWDDRWSYIEFPAPLLDENLTSAHRIPSTANYAQRSILGTLGQPPVDEAILTKVREQGVKLRKKMLELRGEETLKAIQKLDKQFTSPEERKVRSDRREEIHAQMEQDVERPELTAMEELFDMARPVYSEHEPEVDADREDGDLEALREQWMRENGSDYL